MMRHTDGGPLRPLGLLVAMGLMFGLLAIGCDKPKETSAAKPTVKADAKASIKGSDGTEFKAGQAIVFTLETPAPEGKFPLIHIWKSLDPRKRGCSVKPGARGMLLDETTHADIKFFKVKTTNCTGWIKDKLVRLPGKQTN